MCSRTLLQISICINKIQIRPIIFKDDSEIVVLSCFLDIARPLLALKKSLLDEWIELMAVPIR